MHLDVKERLLDGPTSADTDYYEEQGTCDFSCEDEKPLYDDGMNMPGVDEEGEEDGESEEWDNEEGWEDDENVEEHDEEQELNNA
ncbi:hypothetical protein FRC10_008756 [Ceratobasidium sp. 414]|nr:hypothetical protein FRC10_008756 [Ceratobasidium sp. 414]